MCLMHTPTRIRRAPATKRYCIHRVHGIMICHVDDLLVCLQASLTLVFAIHSAAQADFKISREMISIKKSNWIGSQAHFVPVTHIGYAFVWLYEKGVIH